MANNAKNTSISYDARLTKITGARPETWDDVVTGVQFGYLAEDGESFNPSKSITSFRAHQNQEIIRQVVSEPEITFTATLMEDSTGVRELYWGKEATAEGIIETTGSDVIEGLWAYDTIDTQAGYEKGTRYIFEGSVTPNGAISYTATGMTTYPILITVKGRLSIIPEPADVS